MASHLVRSFVIVLVISIVMPPLAHAMERRVDPESGRIRLLYIGSPFWGTKPGLILLSDPKFQATLIPAITVWWSAATMYGNPYEEIRRYMRVYFPRTFDELVATYDLIQLSGCDESVISGRWQEWFTEAVKERGLGLAMTDGYRGFGGGPGAHSTWEGSYLESNLLPTNSLTKQFVRGTMRVRVRVRNTFTTSLPFETAPPIMEINRVVTKEGTTLLMDVSPQEQPLLVYWDIGEGRALSWTCDLHGFYKGSGIWQRNWPYWIDFVLNLDFFAAGLECPSDPALMHEIRQGMQSYSIRLTLVEDLVSFIEKFGASSKKIDEQMDLVKETKEKLDRAYLRGEYPHALEIARQLDERFDELETLAMKERSKALMWIYIIEYLSVTGSLLVVGCVVWMVMVRRRLYKPVPTTRAV